MWNNWRQSVTLTSLLIKLNIWKDVPKSPCHKIFATMIIKNPVRLPSMAYRPKPSTSWFLLILIVFVCLLLTSVCTYLLLPSRRRSFNVVQQLTQIQRDEAQKTRRMMVICSSTTNRKTIYWIFQIEWAERRLYDQIEHQSHEEHWRQSSLVLWHRRANKRIP